MHNTAGVEGDGAVGHDKMDLPQPNPPEEENRIDGRKGSCGRDTVHEGMPHHHLFFSLSYFERS